MAWLDDHTNYELAMPTRLAAPTLDRITALCRLLGDPERACPVIHITGTNGKGSTARILTELLMANGLTVGTYTSPNLQTVNERLARDGVPIDDDELTEVLEALALLEPMLDDRPTRFELLTAAALRWFADIAVDVAVVEVGLGGRWDATNVVQPEVAVVTNVSYDHVEVLGPTLRRHRHREIGDHQARMPGRGGGDRSGDLRSVFVAAADAVGRPRPLGPGRRFRLRPEPGGRGGPADRPPHAGGGVPRGLPAPARGPQAENAAIALGAAEAFFGSPLAPEVVEHACASVTMPVPDGSGGTGSARRPRRGPQCGRRPRAGRRV